MKIIFFFWKAIKIAGSAQKKKNRVYRVNGNTSIFLGLITTDNVKKKKKKKKERSHKAKQSMSKSRENMFSGISDQVL